MADSLLPDAAAPTLPGLQPLGGDTVMGVCRDGVCLIPGADQPAPADQPAAADQPAPEASEIAPTDR